MVWKLFKKCVIEKMVKYVSKELLKKGRVISFVHFGFDCCARLMGSKAGKKSANKRG